VDNNQQAVALFNQLAQGYQDKYMDLTIYGPWLNEFCDQLPQGARLLDIACGPGNISRYLLDKRPDITLLGLDLAPNMVTFAKTNNPEAEFIMMDCRDIDSLNPCYDAQSAAVADGQMSANTQGPFDALVCGFVLPYLSWQEVLTLFGDMHRLMKDDGLVYLSAMTGKPADSGLQTSSSGQQMYIHYHEEAMLIKALTAAGFDIFSHAQQAVTNPSPEREVIDSLFIAKKRP
jgi:predicted TPR repeat methyltransferase